MSVAYAVIFDPLTLLVSACICVVLIACVTSAYYHRSLTHGAWTCASPIQAILLILGAGHGMMSAINWTSAHVKHHRYSDTIKDPHGPMRNAWTNINLALIPLEMRYLRRDVLTNHMVILQARYYWAIMVVYFLLWVSVFGLLSWLTINGLVILTHIAVNTLGHANNTPTNIPYLAPLVGGELYHKNHHEGPANAKFGVHDPGWWFIQTLCDMGLGTLR